MQFERLREAPRDYWLIAPFVFIYLAFQTIVRLTLVLRVGGNFIDTYPAAIRPSSSDCGSTSSFSASRLSRRRQHVGEQDSFIRASRWKERFGRINSVIARTGSLH